MTHLFGDLLRQYIARKHGLTQTRLAHMIGYDQAVLTRMAQGRKDLTGPSGRERVVQIIKALRDERVLYTLAEANALLRAAGMGPLFEGQPSEAALLLSLRAEQTAPTTSAPPAAPLTHTNLPAPLNSFIGREHEIAEVTRLLETTRLLTLTGAGGCGKTRLAIEVGTMLAVAHAVRTDALTFPDGVWLTELAPIIDQSLVAESIVASLHLPPSNRPAIDLLCDYLHARHVLLILDNCEHLIGACAELAEALLRSSRDLRILATSREALRIAGETVWRMPSMVIDEAALLFEQRACAVKAGFTLTCLNRPVITGICDRLDGMPLAIELAAARVAVLSLDEIATHLSDRFRLLTDGSRTALPRHRTLRAMIDWSYELLSENERALLRRLAVFAGGWTFEAAEAVWDKPDTVDVLTQLVNKSLVIVDEVAGQSRYHLLETIRQYAQDRLIDAGEQEAVRTIHLKYFSQLACSAQKDLAGSQAIRTLDMLEREMDNLRVALDWMVKTGDPPCNRSMIDALVGLWAVRGHEREGIAWVDAALLPLLATTPERAWGLLYKGYLATKMGDIALAYQCDSEAYRLALQIEDERLVYYATLHRAAYPQDYESGRAMLEEAVRLSQQDEDRFSYVSELWDFGNLLQSCAKYDEAEVVFKKGLTVSRDEGLIDGIAGMQICLGTLAFARGDYFRARAMLDEGLATARKLGERIGTADALVELAAVDGHLGNLTLAATALQEALEIYRWVGNGERVAQCVCVAAGLACQQGQLERATRLLAATADAYSRKTTVTLIHITFYDEYDRWLATLRAGVEPADFDRAWAEGRQMTLEQAVAYALAG